jgi:hypothetical protein
MSKKRRGDGPDSPDPDQRHSRDQDQPSIERRAFLKKSIGLLPYVIPVIATFSMPRQAQSQGKSDFGKGMMDISPMGMGMM